MDLGLLYNSMGRYEDAAALLEISLPIKRRVLGLQHTWTLSAMSDLVDAYLGLGRGDDALPLQREVLSLELVSADSESTSANELNSAAWTLLTFVDENLRDPERALGYSQRAVAMEEESGGTLSWAFLDTLALAQHKTGNTTGAIETQRRALALMPAGASPEVAQHLAEYEATLRDN
jgi:tetratricopeptide (TPR) repeat protein